MISELERIALAFCLAYVRMYLCALFSLSWCVISDNVLHFRFALLEVFVY